MTQGSLTWPIHIRIGRALCLSACIALILLASLLHFTPTFSAPVSFAIKDRSGVLLGASVAEDGQWRLTSSTGELSQKYIAALIAFEDKRFYLHPGFDPLALFRALYLNIKSEGIVSGGSTITMQTVRLARKNPKRTIKEKIHEIILSCLLEIRYSKKEILSLYSSYAPFGGNFVGLEAASWRYWNRPPTDLTWAEAATLAVLPNQPSLVHPGANRDILETKRNILLNTLMQLGHLNSSELVRAKSEPLPEKYWSLPRLAPHYLERLKKQTRTNEKSPFIITTIDRNLQKNLVHTLESWSARFSDRNIFNAAGIILDTASGEILAYAGNTGEGRSNGKNQDVDIVTSLRSSGSLLKPFLYAALLDSGLMLPEQLIADIPTRIGSYRPENNLPVFLGAVPANEALSRSLNIPAVRELRLYGISPFLAILQKAGFSTFTRSADEYGLPLILGGGEITLEEVTRSYAELMNRSLEVSTDNPKKKILKKQNLQSSPFSVGAAWLTLEALLKGNRPEEEALWQSFASGRKIAWKTGTSQGNRDAWAIGTTPAYTIGIWIGNATGEGRPELKSITTAAPPLFELFSALPRTEWPYIPEVELRQITVCAYSGYVAGQDCEQTKQSLTPVTAPLTEPCPYCRSVSLSPDGLFQASAQDLKSQHGSMPLIQKRFVLPPVIEYWYIRQHIGYERLPPWLPGSSAALAETELTIAFPESGSKIYIPIELDGNLGELILEATHRDSAEIIYWDIDGEFVGETKVYHHIAVRPERGFHTITVTDTRGNRSSRRFEILSD